MDRKPFIGPNTGHQCSFSPTGWCLNPLASVACAREKGCVMPKEGR